MSSAVSNVVGKITSGSARLTPGRLPTSSAVDAGSTAIDVNGAVVTVIGLTAGVTATVQQVKQAMQDLGAKETDLEVHVELPADVLFDFDKADIRPDAAAALAKVATIIRAYPNGSATLEGHTAWRQLIAMRGTHRSPCRSPGRS